MESVINPNLALAVLVITVDRGTNTGYYMKNFNFLFSLECIVKVWKSRNRNDSGLFTTGCGL
ncbi:MAG: hypothetical protein HDR18_01070 [Lachnospiraceae bacterium]|nr:hypothetical protein [Lachnospiraceae bacterium]MBD5526058.1 hypothetical protein [Lachnospiraceae bacterium]